MQPADVPRFAALGVVASMQPVHCMSDLELWSVTEPPARAQLTLGDPARERARLVSIGRSGRDAERRAWMQPPSGAAAGRNARRGFVRASAWIWTRRSPRTRISGAASAGHGRGSGRRHRRLADVVIWSDDLHQTPPIDCTRSSGSTLLAGEIMHPARDRERDADIGWQADDEHRLPGAEGRGAGRQSQAATHSRSTS